MQHFERAEPNQLWQSDLFTFLLRRHERIYVAAFLDDHSRYLVSLAMAHHQRSVLVLEALARGIADYGAPREILTDQGRQYTAWRGSTEFEAELKRHGIAHVKSRPHHPQTCGKIERFWKTLWEELLSRTVFADFEDCQRRVALFIQHYNFQRPHQGLEGLTPADRYFRAASQVRASIEAQVAQNALRLAQQQPLRKPFYLAGQLGDRSVAISASGAALNVRVGDEHTTIPFGKESEDEDHTRASRWIAGRESEEAAAPPAHLAQPAAVADAAGRATGDRAAATLMILSVLSGQKSVQEVIEEEKVSRTFYYQLEDRGLQGMLKALSPRIEGVTSEHRELTQARAQLRSLREQVKALTQRKRSAERLLRLLIKSNQARVTTERRGRPRKALSTAMMSGGDWP